MAHSSDEVFMTLIAIKAIHSTQANALSNPPENCVNKLADFPKARLS